MNYHTEDVIAAIATAMGGAGIGIVRLSGVGCVDVADRIFVNQKGKTLTDTPNNVLTYGHIKDLRSGAIIDEALVSVMRAPHSYTTQDVVEINCHGGVVAVQSILRSVLAAGARMAEPGEFTKRAFLGGRIDLTQAEAVMDIISAKTQRGLTLSNAQLTGSLRNRIDEVDALLVDLLSDMEADIDYPEYDIEEVSVRKINSTVEKAIRELEDLIRSARTGKIYRDGIPTAIIGAPNVGKSSLLNCLIRDEKAIVTDVPGTTRDMIEEYISIQDVPFCMIDTAGIRNTEDIVEKIGVERAKKMIDEAALILFLTDVSRETTDEEKELFNLIQSKKCICIANKNDLSVHRNYAFRSDDFLEISTLTGDGIEALQNKMVEAVLGDDAADAITPLIVNARQSGLLMRAKASLQNALDTVAMGMPVELVSIDLKDALSVLREISGKEIGSAIVDAVFSKFCLGK